MPTERHIYQNGVNKGLEDAAKVAENWPKDGAEGSEWDACAREIAAAIRKRKSELDE